ncbi:ferritin-like domain-containing protein [Jatrophihabitans endophyticus]|uniref:ferritin-like domain-containing protein n=1 Tax=Jatrophihabitans endophyticus TaxID=1206085 RepID=UPI0019EF1183|nr:ferritin-like domain-containing protein [Jatrophihabitans endophyticus]MBE7188988.1 ferritin-like domain-containing protein [Jatrophihabitans endophyticus]
MFGDKFVKGLMSRSSENDLDRRRFLQSAGAVGLGAAGVAALGALPTAATAATPAHAARAAAASDDAATAAAPSDGAILNFALNLEYLEGEFYHNAVKGHGLPGDLTHGKGGRGHVTGGRAVPFQSKVVKQLAHEIAWDEQTHVHFLRKALGGAKVGLPDIDIKNSFTAAARAAGLIGAHQTFDPYANENNFLLAAFIFEDVGVTAYKGAAPLINNSAYLEAAAGILATEAYHASAIRTLLFERGLASAADAISKARDSLDGKSNLDRGILNKHGNFRVAPTNGSGGAFSRTPGEVLNIVYLNPKKVNKGGFFPSGVNGQLHTSS